MRTERATHKPFGEYRSLDEYLSDAHDADVADFIEHNWGIEPASPYSLNVEELRCEDKKRAEFGLGPRQALGCSSTTPTDRHFYLRKREDGGFRYFRTGLSYREFYDQGGWEKLCRMRVGLPCGVADSRELGCN